MMKFFLMIFSKYGNCWRLGRVYGPYEDDKVVEKEIARLWPNNKKKQFLVVDSQQLETLGGEAKIREAQVRQHN